MLIIAPQHTEEREPGVRWLPPYLLRALLNAAHANVESEREWESKNVCLCV